MITKADVFDVVVFRRVELHSKARERRRKKAVHSISRSFLSGIVSKLMPEEVG